MKNRADAMNLARSLVSIGTLHGVRTEAFITNMDTPLGSAVGNALEVAECLKTLKGEGPKDLEHLIVRLATRMVQLAGEPDQDQAQARVQDALRSGAALRKFAHMVERQDGDPRIVDDTSLLPAASHDSVIRSPRSGFVARLDAEEIGRAAMLLGAGRERADAAIDMAAGITIRKKQGERVKSGEDVLVLHYTRDTALADARQIAESAFVVSEAAPSPTPLVIAWVTADGEQAYA
jgi:pyrimidine-nucleoside phosphorylase